MLAALPEKDLIARMGQKGKRYRQLARGELAHFFLPIEAPFRLEESMELDTPVEALESLLFIIGVMLEQIIRRAVSRVLAIAAVTVTLTLERATVKVRTVRSALPTNDRQLWIKLLHLDLEAHPPQAAIVALTLKAEHGSTSKLQLGLFSPQLPEPMRLDVTLARIRAIVGEENVGCAVLKDTNKSDEITIKPFTVTRSSPEQDAQVRVHGAARQLRPSEKSLVTLQDSRPHIFTFRDKRYQVEQAYGPWIECGDWWNETVWKFEQWDLIARSQDDSVLCCCMAKDLLQNRWHVVLLYD
jgi:protein ImuB